VIRFRAFRNSDPPALAKLWNRVLPGQGVVRPLRVSELDGHVLGMVYFDREGLIVADCDERIVGFVHAGFGPNQSVAATRPFELCKALGTIGMLLVEPSLGTEAPGVARGLILKAERYLRSQGAKVLYAGGQFPLNPFYWGVYGGSEASGILSGHPLFPEMLTAMGYEPVSTSVLLEVDLANLQPRDPRAVVIRRETQVEFHEDALPLHWWENLAIGEFHPTHVHLLARSSQALLARATIWDMSWFGRGDGRSRVGLIGLEVAADHRRKGYGRFLVAEVFRRVQEQSTFVVVVQTHSTNQPALSLYMNLGFEPVEQSTIYRLPARLLERSLDSNTAE
jgi:ribosomal protein S18 acetylase RimI-like enzyme